MRTWEMEKYEQAGNGERSKRKERKNRGEENIASRTHVVFLFFKVKSEDVHQVPK